MKNYDKYKLTVLENFSNTGGKKTAGTDTKKKVSFIEQAKKRTDCFRLASYIMTVDLMLNSVLHQVPFSKLIQISRICKPSKMAK